MRALRLHFHHLPPLLLLLACDPAARADAPEEPARVLTTRAELAPSVREVVLHGVVRAASERALGFEVGGRLQARPVEVGDQVERGALLGRLDGRGPRHAVVAAEATLAELDARRAQTERDAARVARLRAEGVASAAELEQTRSGVERLEASQRAAEAQLRESRRRRGETVLHAPCDGVVTAVLAEPGAVVGPGTPVLLLSCASEVEVHASLPATMLAVSSGDPVRVELPARGEVRDATVSVRSVAAGPDGLFPIRVALPGEVAAPGEGAILRLRIEGAPALRVPIGAVVDPAGARPFVWRVQRGAAERVPVEVHGLHEGEVTLAPLSPEDRDDEVALAGLAAGDEVVVRGQRPLLEGDAVTASTVVGMR